MTIEEKAKAYDEALERARKIHNEILNSELLGFPEQIREIFPQLRESEDERIGNVLYCIVRDNKEVKRILESNGVSVDNALAYLEKQKESLHIPATCKENLDSFTDDEKIRKVMLEHFKSKTKETWCNMPVKDIISYLEKQKEYLPIPDKFSGLKSLMLQYLQSAANRKDDSEIESDTDLWGRKILDYVWKYSGGHEEPHYTKRNALFEKCVENCDPEVMQKVSDEVDEMLQKEQKPVEISDEWVEDYWKHHKVNNPDSYDKGDEIQFDHDGFVRFCQQFKKPVEWSKKDKNIIEGMIVDYKGEIEHLSDSIIDEQAKPVYQEFIDFLERLKSYCLQSHNDDA